MKMNKHLKHRNVKNIHIKMKRRTTFVITNTVQTVVKYVGSFQNDGTYCIHYRYCSPTFQLYVYILPLYI
jgi:hypothetical protein